MTDTSVINPNEPYRMADQAAVADWRRGASAGMTPALGQESPLAPPGLGDVQAGMSADVARERQVLQGPVSKVMGMQGTQPKPPNLSEIKGSPPDARQFQKGAMEFASAMAVLGAISSRFTRQPGGAALGAFAAAVNGWQSGNLQAYENAAKQWEEQSRQTISNNRIVLEKYKLALDNYNMNIDQQMNQIQLIAAEYHDQVMYDAAAAKNIGMVGQIYEKGVSNTAKLDRATNNLASIRRNEEAQQALIGERLVSGQINPEGVDPRTGQPFTEDQKMQLKGIKERYLMGAYDVGKKGGLTSRQMQNQRDAPEIADAIIAGEQPPVLTGLYGAAPAVRAALHERGFDLAKAQLEYKAAEKQIQSLNGPQMTRYAGLAESVVTSIDRLKETAREMNNSGLTYLNRAKLAEMINVEGNSPRGKLAARYIADVNTVKEEFANLANGGYAPTEPAWKLANEQINGNYGVGALVSSLDEVQRLINYRRDAIPNFRTLGPGGANRYTGGGTKPAQQGETPAGGAASSKPAKVIQNGYEYTLQPDGSYK